MAPKPRIFIGSTSEASRIAHALKSNLQDTGNIVNVWDGVFRPMHNTLSELLRNISNHDFAIFLLTPDDTVHSRGINSGAVRDNVLFEFGMFLSVLGQERTFAVKPAGKDVKILSDLHGITIASYNPPPEDTFNNSQIEWHSALRDVAYVIQDAIEKTNNVGDIAVDDTLNVVNAALNAVSVKSNVSRNPCLQHIVLRSFEYLALEASTIKDRFVLPSSNYPTLLISLQEKFAPTVKAIALVDQRERFWRQDLGKKILHTINPESERIFVFIDRESLTETWREIQSHAGVPYKVKLINYAHLSRITSNNKDFCIIEYEQQRLVAYYDNSTPSNIVFSINPSEIEAYEKEFQRIQKHSIEVKYIEDLRQQEEALDELRIRLFSVVYKYDQKPVEMSRYLSIDKYDEFEEVHPYRPEMIEKMLQIFEEKCQEIKESRNKNNEPWRILEVGAGTGLFTQRLAELPNVMVSAIEYDSVCFNKLEEKMRKYKNVICMEQDSRSFDAGGENIRYDFIFSCFADHHIHDTDKHQYLTNIYANLEQDGYFIVGEEFLPRYDVDNSESRNTALNKYHQHIIDSAKGNAKITLEQRMGIIDLESRALDSGLKRLGDFKVSTDIYKSLLLQAKLSPDFIKIGPSDLRDVGGVYVVATSKPISPRL